VTLIERPVRAATLLSAILAALRARHRQYDMRDLLAEERRAKKHSVKARNASILHWMRLVWAPGNSIFKADKFNARLCTKRTLPPCRRAIFLQRLDRVRSSRRCRENSGGRSTRLWMAKAIIARNIAFSGRMEHCIGFSPTGAPISTGMATR
jgi:hypothetical protein